MKSYNIQNYIRYKNDLEATLKRIENKEYINYTLILHYLYNINESVIYLC